MDLKELNKDEIVKKVREMSTEKKKLHFHFLTPGCMFNNKEKFAIILENEDEKKSCVCYFDERPEELKIFENLFYNREEKT